jgi:DnaK suppressor protein
MSVNNTTLASIKKRLIARKMEIEADLTRLSREHFAERAAADPTDQASVSTLEDLNISVQNNEHDEYLMIIKALEMIDEGTYGICSDCEQPISEKRLQLYPNATRCLSCQEAAEEKRTLS